MRNFSTKYRIITIIILVVMVFQVVMPARTTRASILARVATSAFSCVIATGLDAAFDSILSGPIGGVTGWINDRIDGFLSNWLPGGGADSIDESVTTSTTKDAPRDERAIKDCLSAGLKRAFIAAIVLDTIDFIKSGDKPRFWENYKEEFRRAADVAAREVIEDVLGVDLCTPFRAHFEIIVELSTSDARFGRNGISRRFACTLSQAIDIQGRALDRFFDDFRYGDWDTWIKLHEPANNELGFYLAYNNELIQRKIEEVEAAQTEIVASDGFVGSKECKTGEPIEDCDSSDIIIATPGKMLSEQTSKAIGAEFDSLIKAESYYEIINEILTKDVSEYLDSLD